MTTKTQAKRLVRLANLLETVPDANFNMALHAEASGGRCGTIGCALGWAALSGKFGAGWGFYLGTGRWAKSWKEVTGPYGYEAVICKGREVGWEDWGEDTFGKPACEEVFYGSLTEKPAVIAALREIARAAL